LQLLATGVESHREELIKIREGTTLSVRSLVNPGPMTCGLAAIQTNKQTNKQNLPNYFKRLYFIGIGCRHVFVFMAFLGNVNNFILRANINVAIVDMVSSGL
jgi:hypothetical protein